MDNTLKTDEEIAKDVQNGQTEAFGELVVRYEPKIARYGRRFLYQYEDVEDAVQDTFIKAFTNIQSFNISMRFSPWIYRIAHNTFVNVIRKRGHEPIAVFDSDTILGSAVAPENQSEELSRKEDQKALEAVLKDLAPKYREPLVLYFFEERDYKDISDIMRIPTSTVGVRIKRGKEKVKKLYQEKYG